ncbi:MAG: hypothetical protein QXY45_00615 [Candidatus Aenigmatarchaeota archaeon]
MDKQEVVKFFLSNGFQLSSNVVEKVSQDPHKFLSEFKKINPRPFIITEEHMKKITDKEKIEKQTEIKILFKTTFEKNILKPEDFINCYSKIYEKTSNILSKNKKMDRLITINKITDKTNRFSIIGMVREKTNNNLLVEDKTGELFLFTDGVNIESIELDDILGFVCENREKVYLREVVYPEIPLGREIGKTEQEIKIFYFYRPSLIQDLNQVLDDLVKTKNKIIFVYGDWQDAAVFGNLNKYLISDEERIVFFDVGGVKILGVFFEIDPIGLINKRMLKSKNPFENFVLEEIPDIILISTKEKYFKNYKGISIISLNQKETYFTINLKTRDIEEKTVK